jgi:hypothetical protein
MKLRWNKRDWRWLSKRNSWKGLQWKLGEFRMGIREGICYEFVHSNTKP